MFEKTTAGIGTTPPLSEKGSPAARISDNSNELETKSFSTNLRELTAAIFTKEVFLGPDPTITKLDEKETDASLWSTITQAGKVLWANSPRILVGKASFALTMAATPLVWSKFNGELVGSIANLLPKAPEVLAKAAETPVPWGIGIAIFSVGMLALVGDLIARGQNIFSSWEEKQIPLITKRLINKVTGSWSFEALDNSKKQLAHQRFSEHAHKLYGLVQSTIDASFSIATTLVAAGLLWKLDWSLSCLAIAFSTARVLRDLKESKTAFAIEKTSAEERRSLEVKNDQSSTPKPSRDMRLLGKNETLQAEYQKGAEKINEKALNNDRRVQMIRLCYDLIPATIMVTSAALIANKIGTPDFSLQAGVGMIGYAWSLVTQCRSVGFQIGKVLQAKTFTVESLEFLNSGRVTVEKQVTIPEKSVPPTIELCEVTVDRGGRSILNVPYLKIKPGQIIGIVGKEGAGKSTLLKTILGMREISKGKITLSWDQEQYDLENCDIKSLHKMVGCCNQDFAIPEGMTVREVLDLGAQRTSLRDELSLEEATTLTHANDFIKQNPSGFDTIVGAGWARKDSEGKELLGVDFSPGQRKLIALATAIRSKSPILVLDEPSSGVSPETAKAVLRNICEQAKLQGQTLFIVSHHFENFSFADHILTIEGGKIVQNDPPQELRHKEGQYRHGILDSAQQLLKQMGLRLARNEQGRWEVHDDDETDSN